MFGGVENLWNAIKNNAAKMGIEATKVMLQLFYVLKSPETSMFNKSLIVAALGYQLLPTDLMPREKYGMLGFLDNGVALLFAYNRVKSLVTPEIEQQVDNLIDNWFGRESQIVQQDWISTDGNQDGKYAPPPYSQSSQQPNSTTIDGFLDSNSKQKPQIPIWDDDEDIVID